MLSRRRPASFDDLKRKVAKQRAPKVSLVDRVVLFFQRRRRQRRRDIDERIELQQALQPEQPQSNIWGTNLTYFVPSAGDSLSIGGPPLPLHKTTAMRKTYAGRDMTRHFSPEGRFTTELYDLAPQGQAKPWPQRALAGVLGMLKWLFKINPKFQIIERYVWSEVIGFFLVGALGFTFFMVVTVIFSFGEKIFSKHIPPFTIAKVLMLSAPQFLVLAIPVAVLFSTLMAMGRLNRDNEVIAMTTSGVSLYRIFIPYVAMAVVAGLLTWTIYEKVVPPYTHENRETLKSFWQAQVVDFIKPGLVIKAPNRKYFYVEKVDETEQVMYGLRLYDYYQDKGSMRTYPRIFIAEKGWVQDSFLVLSNVTFYELDKDRADTLVEAKMPEVRIDIATQLSDYSIREAPEELTAAELRSRIGRQRDRIAAIKYRNPAMTADLNKDWTAYYFKFSVPLACLAFVLVAVPVSLRGPRDERNLGIILSFLLVMVYWIFFFTCRAIGTTGFYLSKDMVVAGMTLARAGTNLFPPVVAGWLSPLLFVAASTVLIARARR